MSHSQKRDCGTESNRYRLYFKTGTVSTDAAQMATFPRSTGPLPVSIYITEGLGPDSI